MDDDLYSPNGANFRNGNSGYKPAEHSTGRLLWDAVGGKVRNGFRRLANRASDLVYDAQIGVDSAVTEANRAVRAWAGKEAADELEESYEIDKETDMGTSGRRNARLAAARASQNQQVPEISGDQISGGVPAAPAGGTVPTVNVANQTPPLVHQSGVIVPKEETPPEIASKDYDTYRNVRNAESVGYIGDSGKGVRMDGNGNPVTTPISGEDERRVDEEVAERVRGMAAASRMKAGMQDPNSQIYKELVARRNAEHMTPQQKLNRAVANARGPMFGGETLWEDPSSDLRFGVRVPQVNAAEVPTVSQEQISAPSASTSNSPQDDLGTNGSAGRTVADNSAEPSTQVVEETKAAESSSAAPTETDSAASAEDGSPVQAVSQTQQANTQTVSRPNPIRSYSVQPPRTRVVVAGKSFDSNDTLGIAARRAGDTTLSNYERQYWRNLYNEESRRIANEKYQDKVLDTSRGIANTKALSDIAVAQIGANGKRDAAKSEATAKMVEANIKSLTDYQIAELGAGKPVVSPNGEWFLTRDPKSGEYVQTNVPRQFAPIVAKAGEYLISSNGATQLPDGGKGAMELFVGLQDALTMLPKDSPLYANIEATMMSIARRIKEQTRTSTQAREEETIE